MRAVAALLGLLALLLAAPAGAAGEEPFAGHWVLDPGASRFAPGARPEAMEIRLEALDGALHYRSEARYPDGREATAEFTATLDGRPAIVEGRRGLLVPVALRRLDDLAIRATYARAFTVVARSRWTVDPAHGTLEIRTAAVDHDEPGAESIAVYRRLAVEAPADATGR
ncbi:MAG: hypothetical protein JSR73_09315 [Proteobacteria bacterium]|nr:hypothetical protein [Pseudomonadota bacterium]